ncbi:MAG: hypothetical protein H0T89_06975 [Deltaproteobacteria bacterium]|nr:hypothetical protein [Deltaproteobacteria bacterium]MDQ3300035.1 hypothetical protein [Myxococcota bacterium]
MESDDLTIHVLREIRDEIRSTNQRVDETNVRLDAINTHLGKRIDAMGERLDKRIDGMGDRITESEMRTATAITGLAGAIHEVRDLLKDRFDLRDRVERCERDIDELKHRAH